MLNEQRINSHLTIGGRPDAAALHDLKERGFGTVLDLTTPDEPGFAAEPALVHAAGLSYASVPVSPELLDDIAMARFSQEVDSSPEPVAVHCKGGGRAGIVTLLYLAVENGWTLEQAREEGRKLNVKLDATSPYRAFFDSYLRQHSAGERK